MLVLFDIDGTLLHSRHAGLKAMQEAARALFGAHFSFDGVEFAGRLDPLIWEDAARLNGIDDPGRHHESFRAAYAELLQQRLDDAPTATLLPGVRALIDALLERTVGLGLVTGNYPETGQLKLAAAGLDPSIFPAAAWGCDGPTRRDLPPVAIAMHARLTGRSLAGDRVLVIGDTPHDVDCARANGCRSIAVATGSFGRDELQSHAPDLAVDDLDDTAVLLELVDAIIDGEPAPAAGDGAST